MGQNVSTVQLEAMQAKEAMFLYTMCWHGCPPPKQMLEAQHHQPSIPLYDSDDETTDSAVVSALAMTDPADLVVREHHHNITPRRMQAGRQGSSTKAPILQPLHHPADAAMAAPAMPPQNSAESHHQRQPVTASALHGLAQAHPQADVLSQAKSSKHLQRSSSSSTIEAGPNFSPAAAPAHHPNGIKTAARAASATRGTKLPHQHQQQRQSRPMYKVVVPLSSQALDAVGAPCKIGGDLPPLSLRSNRGSGADVVGVRPYHHLRMMQLHKQQQQQQQQQQRGKQQMQQPVVQSVWGWHAVPGKVTQVAS